ncbi:hypothetical protein LZP73_19965, partial [Shewanella sp. AS16]|uniref:hypothetical protein n=1 Tax=Shewanella sp. AS16 TaxID=2907625 RepID=UPI001F1CB613
MKLLQSVWGWTNRITTLIFARDQIISLVFGYGSWTITIKPDFILPPFSKIIRCPSHRLSLLWDYPIDKTLSFTNF